MTKLVGLKMQGIRSIGDQPHVLNFLDPLTIIQGENGTGKTTIIEALNYVTSGAMPAGKMGTFIHNNKLSKKKRVDASVQLEFTDFRGQKCVATKRMNASLSAGNKITTKSDEFTLRVRNPQTGKEKTTSAKIADFNKEIESLFGVPSAILQHVIFCHQEESTWPLGEPKELKTKFDAIFEVERFVKAIEAIKKNKKELETEVKLVLAELPHMKEKVTKLAAQYVQREEAQRKLQDMNNFITTKTEEKRALEATQKALQEEWGRASEYEKQIGKCSLAQSRKNDVRVEEARLRTVDPFDGTKEELERQLNEFKSSADFTNSEAEKKRADAERKALTAQMDALNAEQRKWRAKISQIEGHQMVLKKAEADHEALLDEAMRTLKIEAKRPDFVDTLRREIANSKDELQRLKAGDGHQENRKVYNKNVSDVMEELSNLTNMDKQKQQEIAQLNKAIARLREDEKNMDASGVKMNSMQEEVSTRNKEIRRTQGERDEAMDGLKKKLQSVKVYPQVTGELGQVETLTTQLDQLVLQNNGTFSKFVNETIGDKATQLETAKQDLLDREAQVKAARAEMQAAVKAVGATKKRLADAQEKLRQCDQQAASLQQKSAETIQSMQLMLMRLEKGAESVAALRGEMQKHNLDEAQRRLASVEQQVDANRTKIQELTLMISDCDNRQQRLRYFEDNLINLNAREKIAALQQEITSAESQRGRAINVIGQELRRVNAQVSTLQNEIQNKTGARNELEAAHRNLVSQVSNDNIEDAKKALKKKINRKIVLEATMEDMDKFAKVVDDSIIAYHTKKMTEINEQLQELWPKVYQGSDIEFIQIKSNPTDERRKSYDYSVVMVVDQVEIEMRDRCSAGQKMLASILIRIALSDVFGANCSILALDEPTTNLDAIKVENMGTMLHDLLEACKNEDGTYSLQLIVITHDKRLVEHLFTACRPESVYALSKDEMGVSRIKQYHSVVNDAGDVRMDGA